MSSGCVQVTDDVLKGCDESAKLASDLDKFIEEFGAFKSRPVLKRPEYAHLDTMLDQVLASSAALRQSTTTAAKHMETEIRAEVSDVRDAELNRLLAKMSVVKHQLEDKGEDKKAWRTCSIALLTCVCEREQAIEDLGQEQASTHAIKKQRLS